MSQLKILVPILKIFYSIRYNPNFGKAYSNIWIESFSGKGFYQIIDINSNMEMLSKRTIYTRTRFCNSYNTYFTKRMKINYMVLSSGEI